MSVLEDLEQAVNGAVIEFQNKIAELVAGAKAAVPAEGADASAVDADIATVEGDEKTLDADTAELDAAEKAEEAGEVTTSDAPADPGATQIPVTDGTEAQTPGDASPASPETATV